LSNHSTSNKQCGLKHIAQARIGFIIVQKSELVQLATTLTSLSDFN
jgi:hypothetical protein